MASAEQAFYTVCTMTGDGEDAKVITVHYKATKEEGDFMASSRKFTDCKFGEVGKSLAAGESLVLLVDGQSKSTHPLQKAKTTKAKPAKRAKKEAADAGEGEGEDAAVPKKKKAKAASKKATEADAAAEGTEATAPVAPEGTEEAADAATEPTKQKPKGPSRTQSAAELYIADHKAAVKAEFPDLKMKDVMKKCAEMWKERTAEEKAPYAQRAKDLKTASASTDEPAAKADEADAPSDDSPTPQEGGSSEVEADEAATPTAADDMNDEEAAPAESAAAVAEDTTAATDAPADAEQADSASSAAPDEMKD